MRDLAAFKNGARFYDSARGLFGTIRHRNGLQGPNGKDKTTILVELAYDDGVRAGIFQKNLALGIWDRGYLLPFHGVHKTLMETKSR